MSDHLRIALVQFNPIVGDIAFNLARLRKLRSEAAGQGADLLLAGELCVCGYPPEDLALKPAFLQAVRSAVETLAAETADGGPALVVGAPWLEDPDANWPLYGKVFNASLLLDQGSIQAVRYKYNLPNYGVFDEARVFTPGPMPGPVNFRGVRLGIPICEDIWDGEVVECLEESGAELLLVLNASPFEEHKLEIRQQKALARISESGLPLAYVNLVGGQDELVFDGASFVLGADSSLRALLPAFDEALLVTDWRREDGGWVCAETQRTEPYDDLEAIYNALLLGLRDYLRKNRFPGIVIGMSGGIDSALSAAVAVDALGPEKVWCVMMPSPYTSPGSLRDAEECCRLLGVKLDSIDIAPAMTAFESMLAPHFEGLAPDTTEENIQARARGIALMALSNKFGHMVLSTGNKSEMSVGYSTLYGDMCGGYNVLKDVYKTTVYALSRWRNENRPKAALGPAGIVVPEHVITKAPSAELRPDQTDQDSLPPYADLDAILRGLIEEEAGVETLVARGHDQAMVQRVWRMLETAEYKRRQAPPGVKITSRAFGRDRRYPITNAFKGPA